jgi:hypothetical protein
MENDTGGAYIMYGERFMQGFVGKPGGKRPREDPGIYGMITLRWIFRKWNVGVWTGSVWLRIGTGGGHL